tara:strand:- start:1582 stop:2412 length:831 start_codon:yes stop_codon:yes gene_type:complete
MRAKHNKKRNTAFVYEALIKEATIAILKKEQDKHKEAIRIIREHFGPDSLLKRDLECYRSLYENQDLDRETSEKILKEATTSKRLLDPNSLFTQQTKMINDVNKNLSPSVFNNFVPNYKVLATISKMFNTSSPKEKVILENKIVEDMSNEVETAGDLQPIDNLVYTTFVNKFNKKYCDDLLEEQKYLLTHYITSFVDNSLELKIFLNEEIGRLKVKLYEAKKVDEIRGDDAMLAKTDKIADRLSEYINESVSEKVILTVLKTQQLVKEIYEDGSSS